MSSYSYSHDPSPLSPRVTFSPELQPSSPPTSPGSLKRKSARINIRIETKEAPIANNALKETQSSQGNSLQRSVSTSNISKTEKTPMIGIKTLKTHTKNTSSSPRSKEQMISLTKQAFEKNLKDDLAKLKTLENKVAELKKDPSNVELIKEKRKEQKVILKTLQTQAKEMDSINNEELIQSFYEFKSKRPNIRNLAKELAISLQDKVNNNSGSNSPSSLSSSSSTQSLHLPSSIESEKSTILDNFKKILDKNLKDDEKKLFIKQMSADFCKLQLDCYNKITIQDLFVEMEKIESDAPDLHKATQLFNKTAEFVTVLCSKNKKEALKYIQFFTQIAKQSVEHKDYATASAIHIGISMATVKDDQGKSINSPAFKKLLLKDKNFADLDILMEVSKNRKNLRNTIEKERATGCIAPLALFGADLINAQEMAKNADVNKPDEIAAAKDFLDTTKTIVEAQLIAYKKIDTSSLNSKNEQALFSLLQNLKILNLF